jgi:hypothetical protein
MSNQELIKQQNEDRQKEASRMPTGGQQQYPTQYPNNSSNSSSWGGGSQSGNGSK